MTADATPLTPQVRHGLHPELRDVAARLHAEFDAALHGGGGRPALDEVAARFAEAPVRSFVPLLVHRYARHALGSGAPAAEVPAGVAPARPPRRPTPRPAGCRLTPEPVHPRWMRTTVHRAAAAWGLHWPLTAAGCRTAGPCPPRSGPRAQTTERGRHGDDGARGTS